MATTPESVYSNALSTFSLCAIQLLLGKVGVLDSVNGDGRFSAVVYTERELHTHLRAIFAGSPATEGASFLGEAL